MILEGTGKEPLKAAERNAHAWRRLKGMSAKDEQFVKHAWKLRNAPAPGW